MQTSFSAAAAGPTAAVDSGKVNGFRAIYLKAVCAAPGATVQLQTSPDNTTWTTQDTATPAGTIGTWGAWAGGALNFRVRYVRANVTALGTGSAPVSGVLTAVPA